MTNSPGQHARDTTVAHGCAPAADAAPTSARLRAACDGCWRSGRSLTAIDVPTLGDGLGMQGHTARLCDECAERYRRRTAGRP